MRKITLLVIVILVLLAGGIAWATLGRKSSSSSTTATTSNNKTSTEESASNDATGCQKTVNPEVTYENGQFLPHCLTVKAGARVTWVNKSSQEIQIGADPHPTHTGNREVTNGEFVLSVKPGETATSTVTTPGEHEYHDHLNPEATGTIDVQE